MDKVITSLEGTKPGPWCPAYHKNPDRAECGTKKCKYYQNRKLTRVHITTPGEAIDTTDDLDAVSIDKPRVFRGREYFEDLGEAKWHCVRYDEPSKNDILPWEQG